MTKLLSAVIAATFAAATLSPAAFAQAKKEGETVVQDKKDGKAAKKSGSKKGDETPAPTGK